MSLAIILVCPNKTFALCDVYPNAEIAINDYNRLKNLCEDLTGGGGTFYGKVLKVDSINSPAGYYCDGALVNVGYIGEFSCDNCPSTDYQVHLYKDTLNCNKECKQSGRYCTFIFGAWGSTLNGPTYPTCGRVDSTLVGCREEESSSSIAISSSSSDSTVVSSSSGVVSSSSGGGGGEEESSSSGEPINPGDDEEDGGFICNYFSPGEPFETTDLCFESGFIGTKFYKPPTQVGGYNAIKDSIWIKCDYNEVIFHSYIGRIRLNSDFQQKKYCYTNSMCLSDVEYVLNVGEFYDCVYPGGKIGVGCPIPVPTEDLGIDYFMFFVGSDGRLYYDSNSGSFFMPSNISLNELLNSKYDVYEDYPRVVMEFYGNLVKTKRKLLRINSPKNLKFLQVKIEKNTKKSIEKLTKKKLLPIVKSIGKRTKKKFMNAIKNTVRKTKKKFWVVMEFYGNLVKTRF